MSKEEVRILRVNSQERPNGEVIETTCFRCAQPMDRVQLDQYDYRFGGRQFAVPNVWADVCQPCDVTMFDEATGLRISEMVYAEVHPMRFLLGRMEEDLDEVHQALRDTASFHDAAQQLVAEA